MEKGWLYYKIYKEDIEYITYLILSYYKGESFTVKYQQYYNQYCFLLYINKQFYKEFNMNDIVFKSVIPIEKSYIEHLIVKYNYLNKNYKEELIKVIENKNFIYTLTQSNLKILSCGTSGFILNNSVYVCSDKKYVSLMDYSHSLKLIRQIEVEKGFTKKKRRKK